MFFILFNMAPGFENVREIISDYEKEASKKAQHELLTKKKNGETETKDLDDLKIPKLEEIFTTVAIECHRSLRASSPFGRACLQASVIATRDWQF